MKTIEIPKPIIKERTTLGQAFDQMFKETLPINYWCKKNKK